MKIRRRNRRGQSLVEYGLILALVSIVAITMLGAMGNQIKATVTRVNNELIRANAAGGSGN